MQEIILISLAIIAVLFTVSQLDSFGRECDNAKTLIHYKVFAFSIALSAILNIVTELTYGKIICYLFYSVDRILQVIIISEIVVLTKNIIEIEDRYVSWFISFMSYGQVALFFVDTYLTGGEVSKGFLGVYVEPAGAWHMALYFVYYLFYIIFISLFIFTKYSKSDKKRERVEFILVISTYACGVLGFIVELIVIMCHSFIPSVMIFNIPLVIIVRVLLAFHEAIDLKESNFKKELDPSRTDIVFVLDDQLRIIYMNKRAEVYAAIVGDSFADKKITQVFKFEESVIEELMHEPDNVPFGLSAEYEKMGRNVSMVIQNRLDPCGNILATSVCVYNMEESPNENKSYVKEANGDDESMIKNAVSITKGARVLVVDEDDRFLNDFGLSLEQFEVSTTYASGGEEAIERMRNFVYDIVFVTYEMKKMDGYDTVCRIRSMAGDYYRQVPIVYVTDKDINEVYYKFLESGFNDYISRPITQKSLTMVLTRWLWQRFDNDSTDEAEAENSMPAEVFELGYLLEDSEYMFDNKKYDMLLLCANGIKHICMRINLTELGDLTSELMEAILFEDINMIKHYYERVSKGIKELTTVN